jgi:hypothetical protein
MMRYVKPDPAARDVHIWSPTPLSVNRAYHKILGVVKVHGMQIWKEHWAFPATLGDGSSPRSVLGMHIAVFYSLIRLCLSFNLLREVPPYDPKLHCTAAIA